MSAKSEEIRREWKINDDARDAGLTTPEDIVRYDNIQYGTEKEWQLLDVYRPKADAGIKLPVIVSVHGGAWVYGTKETYQFYGMDLAKRGFAVVNFTYRLAPEFKFPAALEDTNLVIKWIMDNANEYDFDTDNIFMLGDSAGGHILGLYTGFCTNKAFADSFDFKVPEGFKPRAIALNCGKFFFNIDDPSDDVDDKILMGDLLENKGTPEELDFINVLNYVTGEFPPTFVMTANKDFLRNQASPMAAKLMECEVPFVLRCYGSEENILYHVFHCNIQTEAAELCNDEECAFFAANMK